MARRVFITGASSGIGKATAVFLARRGYGVVGTAREPSGLPQGFSEEKAVRFVRMDVTDGASVKAGVEEAMRLLGGAELPEGVARP
jgi:NAD(P)-dependent dehydrogenase (short-subunit alcohol dehydrogenase family)